jgi:hypothetical protein
VEAQTKLFYLMFKLFNFKKLSVVFTTMCGVILMIALIFTSCKKEDDTGSGPSKAFRKITWNSDDKNVAAEIGFVPSARTNASGPKITSNAHSADFPGIYFIWDSKQKDNGYLKVAAEVFDEYEGFTLTSKESNKYFDFNIQVQAGQQMTADNCYVFYIPKVYNNKNINMVFISGFLLKTTPKIIIPPIIDEGECINTYTLISAPGDRGVVVDPQNIWRLNGSGDPIKTVWNNAISANYPSDWAAMTSITANGNGSQWIWDRDDSWFYGISGSNLVTTVSVFNIQGEIVENEVPFYFACDNAAVLFVNRQPVHWTTFALNNRPVPTDETIGFTDFSDAAIDGEVWQHLYKADIKNYLEQGENRIVLVAANSDENNGRWNLENNPAGLIYACQFTTNKCNVDPTFETIDLEYFEHQSGGQYGYVGLDYINPGTPLQLIPLAGNGYNYTIVSRLPWDQWTVTNNVEGVQLPVIGTMNPVFNVLGNQNEPGQQQFRRAGYYIVEGYDKVTGELGIIINITIKPSKHDQE